MNKKAENLQPSALMEKHHAAYGERVSAHQQNAIEKDCRQMRSDSLFRWVCSLLRIRNRP